MTIISRLDGLRARLLSLTERLGFLGPLIAMIFLQRLKKKRSV